MASGTSMPAGDCVLVWNMIAAENGLRSRLGYSEWCTGLTGASDDKVRTVISYTGSIPANNRIFSTTSSGIYPCTTPADAPALELAFGTTTGNAGYGTFRQMVTLGGHFGVYCDEVNGYHLYTETGATWAAVVGGSGPTEVDDVDPGDLVHACVFKRRLWFTERDSTRAWYLDAGAVYGAATEFDFGQQFSSGGHLVGLWSWTYDGGAGLDDSLVAISSTGDVVVYQGTDPDDASTFSLQGVWHMGPPPAGRDIAHDVGGDLYILSRTGILPISRLVVGAELREAATAKISNLFNSLMLTRGTSMGWSLRLHPEDNALVVLYPDYSTETDQQLVMAQANRAWFRYRDVPMHCAGVWGGQFYFGTQDGRLCLSSGYLDNVTLADPNVYEGIDWTVIPAFSKLGGGSACRITQIRALLISDGAAPDLTMEARYGFDTSELAEPANSPALSGTWDNGLWDDAVWGGNASPFTTLRGAVGCGFEGSPAVRGRSVDRAILVSVDMTFETGGWL